MGLIDININQDNGESSVGIMKTLNWIIPFILGLISALLLDLVRKYFKKREIRHFTRTFLDKELKPSLPELIEEYIKVKSHINSLNKGHIAIKVFENISIDSLEIAGKSEYFSIYKDKFQTFSAIKAVLTFITSNLPHHLSANYYSTVDSHLKEKNAAGDIEHVKTCKFCIDKRELLSKNIDSRISEIKRLKDNIDLILK